MSSTYFNKPNYSPKKQQQQYKPANGNNGWSPSTKEHDGQILRQFAYNKVFVQADGEYVESADGAEIKIYTREDGIKYIMVNGKPVWLDLMVGSCFVYKPKDGKHYVISHKDGDIGNCAKDNLEWTEKPTEGI